MPRMYRSLKDYCTTLSPPLFLDVPTSKQRKVELCGRELSGNFAEMATSTPFRDLLHAENLRHGTDGFTSPPKEGVLRISSPWKILTASAGFEPADLGT